MAVPQDALPLCRKVGRKRNMLRIRRENSVDGSWCCGTVITVPYRLVARRGDSRITRRPNGAKRNPDFRRNQGLLEINGTFAPNVEGIFAKITGAAFAAPVLVTAR
jgi:hypothetical protein